MSADDVAQIFYERMVREEASRVVPAAFDLPDSIGPDFRMKSEIYLEASLLFALRCYSGREREYERVLRSYERLIFPEAPDFDRKAYVAIVVDAMRGLQSLFDPENTRWREARFTQQWLAGIGHAELNALTLFRITDYWMNIIMIMTKTIQRMAAEVPLA